MKAKLSNKRIEEIQDFLAWVHSMHLLMKSKEQKRNLENSYDIVSEKEIAERMQTALNDFGITKEEIYQYFGKKQYTRNLNNREIEILTEVNKKAGIKWDPEEQTRSDNETAVSQWQILEQYNII